MRLSRVLLLPFILSIFSSSSFARRHNQPPEVLAIVTSYANQPEPGVIRALHDQIESLFKIDSVAITWRELSNMDGRESFDHLVVARFTGHCEMPAEELTYQGRQILGFTHISDGQVIPFLQIDCDRLARLLGPAKVADPFAQREAMFGRALARVVSHEIYHVIADTKQHAKSGIAKPELSRQDLTCEWLGFERADLDRMREKIEESMAEAIIQPAN